MKYEQIAPLVHSTNLVGSQMNVEFKSGDQKTPIAAMGMMIAEQADMEKGMKKAMVKQGVIGVVISSIGRIVSNLIGGGVGGNVAYSAVNVAGSAATQNQMDPNKMMAAKDTPENREKAILKAFEAVKSFYEWDNENSKWKAKPLHVPQNSETV
jgi:hypothetical protein